MKVSAVFINNSIRLEYLRAEVAIDARQLLMKLWMSTANE